MTTRLTHTVFAPDTSLAGLLLRIPMGVIFAAHGAQKLFGIAARV